MKIIRKFSPNEKDLKESSVQSELIRDFPPISKEDNVGTRVFHKSPIEF